MCWVWGRAPEPSWRGFHDTAFEHPAAKLREVTTKVRALLAGEPAHLDTVPGARPLRLGRPPAPDLPIWLAAMGHRTVRVAAELGDGWFPAMVARDRLERWDRVVDVVMIGLPPGLSWQGIEATLRSSAP